MKPLNGTRVGAIYVYVDDKIVFRMKSKESKLFVWHIREWDSELRRDVNEISVERKANVWKDPWKSHTRIVTTMTWKRKLCNNRARVEWYQDCGCHSPHSQLVLFFILSYTLWSIIHEQLKFLSTSLTIRIRLNSLPQVKQFLFFHSTVMKWIKSRSAVLCGSSLMFPYFFCKLISLAELNWIYGIARK